MNKKKLLQVFIIFLIVLISVWFYLEYFNESSKDLKENITDQKVEVVENNTANYIEDIDYTSLDSGGNKYQITAKRAKIDLLNPDIMFLENSKAYMYTQDYADKVKIISDFGEYNSENYDTIFSTNVIITYSDYKITGEYLEFSFLNNLGVISGNVIYSGDNINFITRDTKIFMDNKTKKVLINEKK